MPYTNEEKIVIANNIKPIAISTVDEEYEQLKNIGKNAHTIGPRSRIGNNIVDYFTFLQRLETKGKYNVNFYEFLENIEKFKEKKFIQTMLIYYENVKNKNKTKNEHVVLKEVYNICISAINIMRPLNCMEIYTKYNAKRVLNVCTGWGGALIAASVLNIDAFYGCEINTDLKTPYNNIIQYLSNKTTTKIDMRIEDATNIDYSTMCYDMVFSSPPYYFIEKYKNNISYESKREMNDKFYKPLFMNTYTHLQKGGYYIINICIEVYNTVLQQMLGKADEIFPLKKSKRQNNYTEMVYVWKK